MLNREQIIENTFTVLKKTGIDPKHFYISARAAMVMHGFRKETSDIDVTVSEEVWDLLHERGFQSEEFTSCDGSKSRKIALDEHELYIHLPAFFDLKGQTLDGLNVVPIKTLLSEKLRMDRPKDQQDILKLLAALQLEMLNKAAV